MKIGIILDRLGVGGVEKTAIAQAIALKNSGNEVQLIVLSRGDDGEEVFAESVNLLNPIWIIDSQWYSKIVRKKIPGFNFLSFFHFLIPILSFLKKDLLYEDYDVLLVQSTYTVPAAVALNHRNDTPLVAFLNDPAVRAVESEAYDGRIIGKLRSLLYPLALGLDKWIVRHTQALVIPGTMHARYWKNLEPNHFAILPHSIEVIDAPLSQENRFLHTCIAVTAWAESKHPEKLIDLAIQLPELNIIIAGYWLDESLLSRIHLMIEEANLKDRVQITGSIDEDELLQLYSKVLFTIQTWPSEGFGMSPLEAASQGTTFICPFGQGSNDILDDTTGLFYDLSSLVVPDDLIPFCKRLLNDPANSIAMGELGRKAIINKASWDSWVSNFMAVVEKSSK